jgi:hypothetical protein
MFTTARQSPPFSISKTNFCRFILKLHLLLPNSHFTRITWYSHENGSWYYTLKTTITEQIKCHAKNYKTVFKFLAWEVNHFPHSHVCKNSMACPPSFSGGQCVNLPIPKAMNLIIIIIIYFTFHRSIRGSRPTGCGSSQST